MKRNFIVFCFGLLSLGQLTILQAKIDLIKLNGDLLTACRNGYYERAEKALRAGAEINCTNNVGETPLWLVVGLSIDYIPEEKIVKMVTLLLEQPDIDVNERDFYGTPVLVHALDRNKPCLKVVELLLDHGADVNKADREGRTPLFIAHSREVSADIIHLLKQRGAHDEYMD